MLGAPCNEERKVALLNWNCATVRIVGRREMRTGLVSAVPTQTLLRLRPRRLRRSCTRKSSSIRESRISKRLKLNLNPRCQNEVPVLSHFRYVRHSVWPFATLLGPIVLQELLSGLLLVYIKLSPNLPRGLVQLEPKVTPVAINHTAPLRIHVHCIAALSRSANVRAPRPVSESGCIRLLQ